MKGSAQRHNTESAHTVTTRLSALAPSGLGAHTLLHCEEVPLAADHEVIIQIHRDQALAQGEQGEGVRVELRICAAVANQVALQPGTVTKISMAEDTSGI